MLTKLFNAVYFARLLWLWFLLESSSCSVLFFHFKDDKVCDISELSLFQTTVGIVTALYIW